MNAQIIAWTHEGRSFDPCTGFRDYSKQMFGLFVPGARLLVVPGGGGDEAAICLVNVSAPDVNGDSLTFTPEISRSAMPTKGFKVIREVEMPTAAVRNVKEYLLRYDGYMNGRHELILALEAELHGAEEAEPMPF